MDMPLDLVDRIRSFPLFLSAPDTFLAAIGKHLRPQVHAPNDHILTEGDDAKAMYWIVRGVVAVTSRDGEAILAELKPGAFFGEIGILMDVPRTATIIARTKVLLVVLKKDDLMRELPGFPEMEKAIREEAQERLTILDKKRGEGGYGPTIATGVPIRQRSPRERISGDVEMGEVGRIGEGTINIRKRKSPSPGAAYIEDRSAGSALGSGFVNVRKTLKELPLFSTLPADILHFLGLSAQPCTYPPFTDIVQQGSRGNEIYFIVWGEAEVIHHTPRNRGFGAEMLETSGTRPRLRQGQYFGEVASLALAPRRTATVRAITTVECLMISGEVLEELWRRCSPDLRRQVEATAKTRYGSEGEDAIMNDAHTHLSGDEFSSLNLADISPKPKNRNLPQVTFTPTRQSPSRPSNRPVEEENVESTDPDPYLSVDMDNMKARMGRRPSWAPSPPGLPPGAESASPKVQDSNDASSPLTRSPHPRSSHSSSSSNYTHPITPPHDPPTKRPRMADQRRPSEWSQGRLGDKFLIKIFQYLDIYHLMRLRCVSLHWNRLLSFHPSLCQHLDLSLYNRRATNQALVDYICPFIGNRPRTVDISNCFHTTDLGFAALVQSCGANIKSWRMKSVWDISAGAVLEMANTAKGLEEIDLSNCRKVSDNLLARIVGWVVQDPAQSRRPRPSPFPQSKSVNGGSVKALPNGTSQGLVREGPPHGTIVGCPKLSKLTLSYCKHITDRSMAHLAVHASSRLQSLDLTRCTTITDQGFAHWGNYRFERLEKLILADCTYLTDNAIVGLCQAAKNLRELDLSFCCALSDTATEVLSLGLPLLRVLRMAFCGSAVSDSSLGSISLHLLELRELSVRGCVRVTGNGVEAVVEGCNKLEVFDVSQCKNVNKWLQGGGVERSKNMYGRPGLRYLTEKFGVSLR